MAQETQVDEEETGQQVASRTAHTFSPTVPVAIVCPGKDLYGEDLEGLSYGAVIAVEDAHRIPHTHWSPHTIIRNSVILRAHRYSMHAIWIVRSPSLWERELFHRDVPVPMILNAHPSMTMPALDMEPENSTPFMQAVYWACAQGYRTIHVYGQDFGEWNYDPRNGAQVKDSQHEPSERWEEQQAFERACEVARSKGIIIEEMTWKQRPEPPTKKKSKSKPKSKKRKGRGRANAGTSSRRGRPAKTSKRQTSSRTRRSSQSTEHST